MSRRPDPQQKRVYKAESILPPGKALPEVEIITVYVVELMGQSWFRHYWPYHTRPIKVSDGRRRRRAGASSFRGEIRMPRRTRYEASVLHEVAHIVTHRGEPHGAFYCRNLIRLIEGTFGRHDAMLLEGAFRGRHCKVEPEARIFAGTIDRAWRESYADAKRRDEIAAGAPPQPVRKRRRRRREDGLDGLRKLMKL